MDRAALDEIRKSLATPERRRTPLWVFVLAAGIAAVVGVSTAAVTIFGPGQPAGSAQQPR